MTQTTNNGWQQAIYSNTKALGGLEVKVDRLETKVDSLGTDVAVLKDDVKSLKSNVAELKDNMKALMSEVSEIKPVVMWVKVIAGIVGTVALGFAGNYVYSIYQSFA
ncbi:MAG: hypothetical protein ACFB4I_10815 [Cyanophyceae cyanobacterium]